jgi:site-specific recombinase XerD
MACGPGDDVASMAWKLHAIEAWGARNLISTQVAAAARGAFATWLVREGAELRDVVDLLRFPARPA